jgi:lycopene cyclase domain-containing protein
MNFIYLAALLFSVGGLAVLDRRLSLAFWHAGARTWASLIAGVGLFIAWDIAGIGLGIFWQEDSPYITGLFLAPELPIEEAVFLFLLCYCALLAWRAGERFLRLTKRQKQP